MQTHNPAPRISILHALSQPSAFLLPSHTASGEGDGSARIDAGTRFPSPTARKSSRTSSAHKSDHMALSGRKWRRRRESSASESPKRTEERRGRIAIEQPDQDPAAGGDLREIETLFRLWKAAGRSVNLWDWLEGFRESMLDTHDDDQVDEERETNEELSAAETNGEAKKAKPKRKASSVQDHTQDEEGDMAGEETPARLHATFIRFCEEARMLGLVRARGKGLGGRRIDEVVKGIGIV